LGDKRDGAFFLDLLSALRGRLSWRPLLFRRGMPPVQLALRVSSTSVTVITPGAGCSITSTATVSATASTTGATGCFTFRAAFFTGARLGLALATVFARAALCALPRLAEFARRSLARLCAFDPFLRLAMIRPVLVGGPQRMIAESRQPIKRVINRSSQIRPNAVALGINDHHLTTNSLTSLHSPIPK
jgi:hypothetical protein